MNNQAKSKVYLSQERFFSSHQESWTLSALSASSLLSSLSATLPVLAFHNNLISENKNNNIS